MSLGKVKQAFKGHFICIKNDLMEIAPGAISIIFYYSLYSKTIWLQGLNFSCITVNVCVGLNSEWEAATAKYVGVNKLREILIEIASFDGNKAGCSIHSHLLAWVTEINVIIIYRVQFIILIFVKMSVMAIDHLQRHR